MAISTLEERRQEIYEKRQRVSDELKIAKAELDKQSADLRNHITKLDAERDDTEKQLARLENEYFVEHADVILPLLHHTRTSCSDSNPCNGTYGDGGYRCIKCALIEMVRGEFALDSYRVDWGMVELQPIRE